MPFKLPMAVLAGALSLAMGAAVPAFAASSEVTTIVGDTRPSAELTDKELRKRLQTLKAALDDPNTSDAARKELRGLMRADRAEQETRGAAAGDASAPDSGTADTGAAPASSQDTAASANDPAAENAGGGSEVATIDSVVSTTKPSSSLSDGALAARLAEIEAGLGRSELPRPLRRELKTMQDADTAELQRRKQAVAAEQPAAVEEPAPVEEPAAAASNAPQDEPAVAPTKKKRTASGGDSLSDARQLLMSSRSLDQLPERELRSKLSDTKQLLDDRTLPGNLRGKLTDLAAKLRNEIRRRSTAASTDPAAEETIVAEQQPKKRNKEDGATLADRQNATDKLALVYINDTTKVERLPRSKLRERLEAYRKLLASGQLELYDSDETYLRTGTFDPERMLADRRAGMSTEEISDRSLALAAGERPPALAVLLGCWTLAGRLRWLPFRPSPRPPTPPRHSPRERHRQPPAGPHGA